MKRLDRWLSLGLILTLGFLLGVLGFSLWDKMPSTVDRIAWSPEVQWIAPHEPSYRFYTRRTFYVADSVQTAWLRISADNNFILYVNGSIVTKEVSLISRAKVLADVHSQPYQNFNDSHPYRILNGAAEFLLANSRHWKLTTYIDLTPYLHPGKNTIALEIQKGQKNPRVVVEGAVYTVPGTAPINLTTGATPWHVSNLSETRQGLQWFDLDFPDQSWPEADTIGSVQEATYSRLSQHLFDRLLQGFWIEGNESSQGEIWLRGNWQIPKTRKRAYIRFAGDGEYGLLINGLLVNRYGLKDRNHLHMYEVTNFLKTGNNTLAVRLAHPLDPNWSATQNGYLTHKGSLGFFLDGWVETDKNSIVAPIATDSTWSTLPRPISGWVSGSGPEQPATILEPPDPQEFQRQFEGDAYLLNYPNYLWHNSLWVLAGIGCSLVYAWFLGRFWLGRQNGWWDSFNAGTALLLPGTLFLIGIGLLKHRFAEEEQALLFAQPQSNPLVLLSFVGIVVLTLLWGQMRSSSSSLQALPRWGLWFLVGLVACISLGLATVGIASSWSLRVVLLLVGFAGIVLWYLFWNRVLWSLKNWSKRVLQADLAWGHWFLLLLIVGIGFGLRAYNLGFTNLEADENTSFDAIRGILRTGVPEPASHIWYTRGPFYHYMVALWLRLVGDSSVNARFLSVLWGTATLVLIFIFTRKITEKVWLALLVTAIFAIDPSELWFSRFIRFYQVVQFMSLLVFWSFLKGFIERKGRLYQYIFFIALTLNLLNQEVTVTLLPGFLMGFVFFYRPFRLSVDWPVVLSSLMTVIIYIYDGIFFSIKCLTPWVALSSNTDLPIKFHLYNVANFFNVFFDGPRRLPIFYTLFFFLGFVYFLRRRNGKLIFFFSIVFLHLILLTILVPISASRYIYSTYPLLIILGVYSAYCLMESLGKKIESTLKGLLPLRQIAIACITLLLLSNLNIGGVLAVYQDSISKRNTEVAEYIRDHRQPGDVVVSATPFPVANVLHGLDYYLMPGFSSQSAAPFDTVYWREGRIIDRWAGGVVINSLDQMSHVLEKANRVWILLDDTKLEGKEVNPALVAYFETLGKTVMESFGSRLRLWQRDDGLLPRVPNQSQDLGVY